MSSDCAIQPAIAESFAEHRSHEWDRDDEADDTIEAPRSKLRGITR